MPRHVTRLRDRITLEVAPLRDATSFIVEHHYLHRGRTMAQLPYWILVDGSREGVVLFALPRLSTTYQGYHPMRLLELARLWVSPEAQRPSSAGSDGTIHANGVAGCAVAAALRRIRDDWARKYPAMPRPSACVAWADLTLHTGTIYKATNFEFVGVGGGRGPGKWKERGSQRVHRDYLHPKAAFLYRWEAAPEPSELQPAPRQPGTGLKATYSHSAETRS